ncbi:Lrp/AsnC family transcriptional regulator [Candidatus Pacearchaeota archaeon]|nr:Lrp/AsnC family transcriptional regulator [Candidatus Pacearchaeota archaeon]
MKLTKNEKKTLHLLLENGKISDSNIANKLKISSQAVGKIRKKLESTIIDSYSVNLNYSKLGIKTFCISLSKLTEDGKDIGELELEQKLNNNPNVIEVYRLPTGNFTHLILFGFTDTDEMDNYFHSNNQKNSIHKFLENQELFTFSNHSLIKNSPIELFKKTIENFEQDNPQTNRTLTEIKNFKNRLNK